MPIPPAYPDISKNANSLLDKDFYHLNKISLDVKSQAPNGVAFNFKGKTGKDDSLVSSVEAKIADKANGLTLTQGWNSLNLLSTKVELTDALVQNLKAELVTLIIPSGSKAAKLNLYYSQLNVNARGFFDLLKGPTFFGDVTVGHEGYVVGGDVGYDIYGGKLTRWAAGLGYVHPVYSVGLNATNNFNVFTASYFHKISPIVEAGAKATYDTKTISGGKPVAVEFAAKYALDPTAFVKAKIADSGNAALSYSQKLNSGVTLGVGASFDALRLAEPVHKLGLSLSFAA